MRTMKLRSGFVSISHISQISTIDDSCQSFLERLAFSQNISITSRSSRNNLSKGATVAVLQLLLVVKETSPYSYPTTKSRMLDRHLSRRDASLGCLFPYHSLQPWRRWSAAVDFGGEVCQFQAEWVDRCRSWNSNYISIRTWYKCNTQYYSVILNFKQLRNTRINDTNVTQTNIYLSINPPDSVKFKVPRNHCSHSLQKGVHLAQLNHGAWYPCRHLPMPNDKVPNSMSLN